MSGTSLDQELTAFRPRSVPGRSASFIAKNDAPSLATGELEQLKPGGAPLLAESFSRPWQRLLRTTG